MSNVDPINAFQSLIDKGEIKKDSFQQSAMEALQRLSIQVNVYQNYMGQKGWLSRLKFGAKKGQVPRGIYIWGGVGRGKSMLMDLFFEHAGVHTDVKKHIHFNVFMREVHSRIHLFRKAQVAGTVAKSSDPLIALSKVIIDQAWLLCFDEFHVTDIADAMVLGRLIEALFDQGVVVVATSNRHPSELYKNGLQRERFIPFIDLIMKKMDVVQLDSGTDYRLDLVKKMEVYITPSGPDARKRLKDDFQRLTLGAYPAPISLQVNDRRVTIPQVAKGVVFAHFKDLCGLPLGSTDYLEIAKNFHTLIISDIPKMGPDLQDQAKRFILLIDVLYEANINLICSAEVSPMELYVKGKGAFEFERTASRLIEMQSEAYLARHRVS